MSPLHESCSTPPIREIVTLTHPKAFVLKLCHQRNVVEPALGVVEHGDGSNMRH